MEMTKETVAGIIDHTQLAATATSADIENLCAEAARYGFASVCVNPVCTVVGFPLGADATEDKAAQAGNAVEKGADEVDMVIPIGAVKEGRFDDVERDIFFVVQAARTVGEAVHKKPALVKVILETCYLTDEEIVHACKCAKIAGAQFVKTSTGFATPKDEAGKSLPNGASSHAVALMRKTVGDGMGVKASGGIRSAEAAREMIAAGANRLGTSSGVKIIEEW